MPPTAVIQALAVSGSVSGAVTVVDSLSSLLPATGSSSSAVTVALFVIVAGLVTDGAVTTMSIVAVEPSAMLPRVQVRVPPARLHVPCDGSADWNVVPPGRLTTTTLVAVSGPWFLTRSVYFHCCPS